MTAQCRPRFYSRMRSIIRIARRRWLLAAAVFAAATVLGLIDASQVQYDRGLRGEPITWPHALMHGLPQWYAWALLAPIVFLAAKRIHGLRLDRWLKALAHAVAAVLVVLVQVWLLALASRLLHGSPQPFAEPWPAIGKYMGLFYFGGLVVYVLLVAGWHGARLLEQNRVREVEASRLRVQTAELNTLLAESRLRHLQSQLQPHFLFNTLHALGALVYKGERETAIRMTARLSDLLRRSLRLAEQTEIPVDDELRLAEDYLSIQKLRYGDRLGYSIDASAEARAALVPVMLLQPLVENALLHGVEAGGGSGRIEVEASREGDTLVLIVRDDGPGIAAAAGDRAGGMGLDNTRARLASLHGVLASVSLISAPGSGVEARVRLPYRSGGRAFEAGAAEATR